MFTGFASHLRQVHYILMPIDPLWNCRLAITVFVSSSMWSTLIIISMTSERFYSIVKPHKAASFNTSKKANITITCCLIFSCLFNVPNLFLSINDGVRCIALGIPSPLVVYFWLTFVVGVILPFIFLLSMNGVIIHTLKTRPINQFAKFRNSGQGHGQSEKVDHKMKNTEKQISITLHLITFCFIFLTTPAHLFTLYALLVKNDTPRMFAGYYLFKHVSQKMLLTNNGINFFLYITSGQKFRTDLLKLFQCKRDNVDNISRFAGSVKGSDESDAKRFRSRNRTLLKK